LRWFSPEYVIDEIKHLIENYRIEGLMFNDDLFIANKERVMKIAELIRKEKINEQIEFNIMVRANLINDEILKILKSMNVTTVAFGMESGSEKILEWLKTGSVTVEDNYRALRLCKKYGLRTIGNFIIGSPGETKEDMMKTLQLMEDKDMDSPILAQLTPYPNTPIWDIAKNMGMVSEDVDFDYHKLNLFGIRPEVLMNREMSVEEFREIYNTLESVVKRKEKSRIKISRRLLSPKIIKKALVNWRTTIPLMKTLIKNSVLNRGENT
jgi:anaerobic magnesium-protoporphyrin IX monomethyl ester cyclase